MNGVEVNGVADRLAAVRARIERASGNRPDGSAVEVVAVTKGFGPEVVAEAVAAGIRDLGENYADELIAKHSRSPSASQCRWHYLGRVQRNKVRHLAGRVSVWQSVDRVVAGEEIAKRAPGARVLVQVNVTGEPTRNGCVIGDAPALVDALAGLGLDVCGLMAVGPVGDPERVRPAYRQVGELSRRLGLSHCSMGMTDDLEVAVEEGATMVRVGRALFGPRSSRDHLRR
ncbi:MAG: YggS family pyridoxal phosphate-dependent enzyme [Acidimicrobiales bacterium]